MMDSLLAAFPILTLLRFALVGCVGVLVDFGVTFLLKEKLDRNKYLASAAGFFFAATNNYLLNRLWTFNNTDPQVLLQYGRFIGIALVGLALSYSIVWLLYEKFRINFYGAKGLSIVLVMVWNFMLNTLYTFT